MSSNSDGYFSARLDPELLDLLDKLSIETPPLNSSAHSESTETNKLSKDSSVDVQPQLNITLDEDDLDTDCNILNNREGTGVNFKTELNNKRPAYISEKKIEKNEPCSSKLESLVSSNKIAKEPNDTDFEKILEDFNNLIIIEENSDSENEKENSDDINERGPKRHPKQNVRFHPVLRNNGVLQNDDDVCEIPYAYSSSLEGNNEEINSNPSFIANYNNQFPYPDDVDFDPNWMINNIQFSDINSRNLNSSSSFSDLDDVTVNPFRTISNPEFPEINNTVCSSSYETNNNDQFPETNISDTSNTFHPRSLYLETMGMNSFDDVGIGKEIKSLQVPSNLGHTKFNTDNLRKEILSENLQNKFLPVEDVEHLLKTLPKSDLSSDSKFFCEERNNLIIPPLPLLSFEVVEKELRVLPELNHGTLFTSVNENGNLDPQLRFSSGDELNFASTSNSGDNSNYVNPDGANELFNCISYLSDQTYYTNANRNSSSDIHGLAQSLHNLFSVEENPTNLSSTYESSDYDKVSLEIESKISLLCVNTQSVEDSNFVNRNMSSDNHSLSPNISESVQHNNAERSNHYYNPSQYRRVSYILGTAATNKLLSSSYFDHGKQKLEEEIINREIKRGLYGTNEIKVIHLLKKNRKRRNKITNLHEAVLKDNIEKAYSIVEIHKRHHGTIEEINIRDSLNNKTALDYANSKGMDLLADYFRENLASESVIVEPRSPLSTIGI
ncbi:uncharacterized protein NPIL_399941 [Nephila pilipes]|uniref:Uncharacterized protein n=1 Tax=Nephila pilipes TaxID=299642 RepID=A0A8X6PQ84_NEPPI|nr:uncharacterized protein NPIL_399941 [Nephila pilipes]